MKVNFELLRLVGGEVGGAREGLLCLETPSLNKQGEFKGDHLKKTGSFPLSADWPHREVKYPRQRSSRFIGTANEDLGTVQVLKRLVWSETQSPALPSSWAILMLLTC